MFHDRFTDRVRTALNLAREEAQRLNHDHIGTEHMLLGLLRERAGVASEVLDRVGVTLERARAAVARLQTTGATGGWTRSALPFSMGFKRAIERAAQEAGRMGHAYIGTEDVLLGMMAESGCTGARILSDLGVQSDRVHEEVVRIVGPAEQETALPATAPPTRVSPRVEQLIQLASEEAQALGDTEVATDHLLLALLREPQGTASRVFQHYGLDLEDVRQQALRLSGRQPVRAGSK